MNKEIKGNIEYTVTIKDGMYSVSYISDQNNDIAALGIANQMFADLITHYQSEKMRLNSMKQKKELEFVTNMCNTVKRAKAGADKIMNLILNTYDGYKELRDEKHEEIKKYFNDNNISIETGMLSAEQVDELLKDKFKDLASIPHKNDINGLKKKEKEIKADLKSLNKIEKQVDRLIEDSSADENLTNL